MLCAHRPRQSRGPSGHSGLPLHVRQVGAPGDEISWDRRVVGAHRRRTSFRARTRAAASFSMGCRRSHVEAPPPRSRLVLVSRRPRRFLRPVSCAREQCRDENPAHRHECDRPGTTRPRTRGPRRLRRPRLGADAAEQAPARSGRSNPRALFRQLRRREVERDAGRPARRTPSCEWPREHVPWTPEPKHPEAPQSACAATPGVTSASTKTDVSLDSAERRP